MSEYEELPNTIDSLLHCMNQELTCPICLSLLNQCTSTPCGHIFCKQCILHSLSSLSKCPICKTTITKRALLESESMEAVVREFEILRQHYERKTGNVLSQLPNKEYEEPQITDLSLLFPYPTKETNFTTQPKIIKNQNEIESSINNTEELQSDDIENANDDENNNNNSNREIEEDRHHFTSTINKHQSHVAITPNILPNDKFCTTQDTTDSSTQNHELRSSLLLKIKSEPSIPSTLSSNAISISQLDHPPKSYLIYVDISVNDLTKYYLKELENLQLLKTSTTIISKITHFIMAADDQNNIIKINKTYLGAIVLRKHIVHENWIKQCFEEKKMIDIKSYLVHNKPDKHKDGPRKARLSYLHGVRMIKTKTKQIMKKRNQEFVF
ncbi:unnamed protein product [Cunninghamella blakesleeana]